MDRSDERLTKLEEAVAFGERTIEQMHEVIVALQRTVESLTGRVARAEAALSQKADRPDDRREDDAGSGFELPPHSHMPLDRSAGRTTDPFAPSTPPPEAPGR